MTTNKELENNVIRTLWLGFFQVFLVIMPIAVPFFQSKGLSMQDVFSLQAFFGFVVVITEVPSGYLADVFGRKKTLVVGAVFAGVGHSLLIVADGFWTLALFELALGISHSLISGADIALLYDTELALGRSEQKQRQVVGRLYSIRTVSEATAAVACSVLLLWSMDHAVYVQAIVGWFPLAIAVSLIEPGGKRLSSSNHADNMLQICRHLLTHSRVLRLVFIALCIWSLTTFYAVWLLQKLWELQEVGLSHFGYLWAVLTLAAALAGRYAHLVEERLGAPKLLLMIGLLPIFGYLGLDQFGLAGGYLASLTFFVSRGFGLVLLRDALNRRIPGEFRATANSLASFGFRGAFVLTGPFVGYYYDLWGMHETLYVLAAASLVIFVTLIVPLIRAVQAQERTTAQLVATAGAEAAVKPAEAVKSAGAGVG